MTVAPARVVAIEAVHLAVGALWALVFFVGDGSHFPYAMLDLDVPRGDTFGRTLAWIALVAGSAAWAAVARVVWRSARDRSRRVAVLGGEFGVPYWAIPAVWLAATSIGSLGLLKLAVRASQTFG